MRIELSGCLGLACGLWIALVPNVMEAGTVTVLSEGFESGFPAAGGWSTGDENASNGYVYWNDVNSAFGGRAPHGGSYKAYCAGYGYGGTTASPTYREHMNAFMEKTIDLTGATDATLTFWSLAPSFETLIDVPRVFLNGVLAWDLRVVHPTWTKVTISLQSQAGSMCILDFKFWSDFTTVGEGWYIDDILVTKSKPDVDLRTRLVSVTRPADTSLRTFSACGFRVDNFGQGLSNSTLTAEYYLSSDTTFGNAGDRKIGETIHTNVTIGAGGYYDVTLNSAGRGNMVKNWTQTLVAVGSYYVFVKITGDPARGTETNPGNNVERTGSTFAFTTGGVAWDNGYTDIGGGWRRLAWFGDYIPMGGEGWIWHNKHGFLFVPASSTPQNIWMFAQDMGWLYTGNALYPFLYRASPSAWLWYNGAKNPRWFRNFTTDRWESRP